MDGITHKELLEGLIPAIEEVDGGCFGCMGFFVLAANKALEELGVPYRYKLTQNYELEHPVTLEKADG